MTGDWIEVNPRYEVRAIPRGEPMGEIETTIYVDFDVPQPGLVVECGYTEDGERYALRMTAVGKGMRLTSLDRLTSQLDGVEEILIDSLVANREERLK